MTVSVIKAFILPPGYAHDHDHLIVLDPDIRIQDAVRTLFQKFDQFTSIRQLALWYADTKTPFPVRKVRKSNTTEWEVPTFSNIRKLLAHPIYAGVYTYGRRPLITEFVDGKIVKKQGPILPPERAAVYRPNNHEQYISWEKYLANQEKIATTRPRTQMEQNQGAVRDGLALLAGILRCGHCGRKIYVAYKRTQALYFCDGGNPPSSKRCLVFGSYLIDKMVTEQLIEALAPLAIKASETAFIQHEEMRQQDLRQGQLRVQAAQYQADKALEQYDLVDPKNRLVASSLEQRLNQRLAELHDAKCHLKQLEQDKPEISEEQKRAINNLAGNFDKLWHHPNAPIGIRKRLVRTAIEEIVVSHIPEKKSLDVVIHWKGGTHTGLFVKKRARPTGSKADQSLVELVRKLASCLDDPGITRVLNMKQTTTPRGLPWTQQRVHQFRKHHHIRLTPPSNDPNILNSAQVSEYLGISRRAVSTLASRGIIDSGQVTDFAPWAVNRAQLDSEAVQNAVLTIKNPRANLNQGDGASIQGLLFSTISEKE